MSEKLGKNKVSVVIPMYNSEDTIIRTLESVRKQTAFNMILEILVINDGSTDKSFDIVKEYADQNKDVPIRLIDKPNGGVSTARNKGMKEAKGEFIALLDSDDEWLPEKIEVQMKTIKEHPEIDFLGGDANGKSLSIFGRKIDTLYKANVKDLCLKTFPLTPAALFRKKIVDEIGYFDENQQFAEDIQYFYKICNNYNYYHLPVQVVQCGCGKPSFGFSGLSSNLKGMHEGTIKNIKELREESIISTGFYIFLRVFYWMKYIRRIIITKLR
ncbi:MAG: glycosyltransferase family A protein [Clostridium cadaveris]|uniref:glycosyltransferase family 2 protein n=1 Tax=Clostridium TaxID=1485 RepID=UPI001E53518E|nr:glycosyltransferase family A protein [Clostridium cadaveris]MDU4952434.1 glycosyltransferase family A protein [Clostridium sp.]MDY4948241.1 glycosyltransferase family A protein [Clostridium cadaveris]UFH65490.1 glycosyltransferase family 2 protein [Clostridium cadaveris]